MIGTWLCVIDGQQIDIANEDEMVKYRNHLVVSIKAEDNQINLEIKP